MTDTVKFICIKLKLRKKGSNIHKMQPIYLYLYIYMPINQLDSNTLNFNFHTVKTLSTYRAHFYIYITSKELHHNYFLFTVTLDTNKA